jgi:acyl dehydratase
MTDRGAIRATLAAAALAISLAGCGGGDPAVNTGPLGGRGYGGQAMCSIALAPHAVYTAGSELAFRNAGPAVMIDKVTFTRVDGLRLVAAYTVPNTGQGGGYGDRLGYPPPQRDLQAGVLWSRRQRADGAHIPPTPPKPAAVDLVLVIQLTGATGTYQGIDIYYHTSGGHFHMHADDMVTLRTKNDQACPHL